MTSTSSHQSILKPGIEKRKTALVTGCSEPASLGSAFCRELLKRGWRVFATARKVETMAALKAGGSDVLALDVQSVESIQAAVDEIKASAGRLDLLINNAGVAGGAPGLRTDPARMAEMFDINVFGPLRVMQAAAPLLVSTANAGGKQGFTHIVNIGSVAAWGIPWQSSYDSSKAALQSLSNTMRREMLGLGIKISTVELAMVETPMSQAKKSFPVAYSSPSAPGAPAVDYYAASFPAIDKKMKDDQGKRLETAPKPDQIAKEVLSTYESKAIIWAGEPAWVFKWLWPLLPVFFTEWFWRKMTHCNDVVRPQAV